MKFNNNKIRQFFLIFGKNITNNEISILKGKKSGALSKNEISNSLIAKVCKYKYIFLISPFIEEVFICNNVAFGCARRESDIDLFIITKNDKIWTARLLLSVLIHIIGLRRYKHKCEARFCLSFWASEKGGNNLKSIQIENNNDPYLAIWTTTLIPILNKGYFSKFQESNHWIGSYGIDFVNKKYNHNPETRKLTLIIYINKILEILFSPKIIEKLFKKVLSKRAVEKQKQIKNLSGTIISDEILKFHDKDIRGKIKKILD